ncbi:MAG: penicillin-binding transpeptidase domain-containing protein [Gammaproteobacteria bacterium]
MQGRHGTARRSGRGADYQFAGKTGTAQVVSITNNEDYESKEVPEELRDHALFIAFAPLKSPTIALAVVVENGGSGSSGAAPIARKLLDHYLDEESSTKG